MFLLCIYEKYNDGNATRKTIKDYDSYNEALKVLFTEQSKAINANEVNLLTTTIMDDEGIQYKTEVYKMDS